MLAIIIGSIVSGKRRMLNKDKETNAFSASSMLSRDDNT